MRFLRNRKTTSENNLNTNAAFETFLEKIVRHLKDPSSIDLRTFRNGLYEFFKTNDTRILESMIFPTFKDLDWTNTGVAVFDYGFFSSNHRDASEHITPNIGEKKFASSRLCEFPINSTLDVVLYDDYLSTSESLLYFPEHLASVSGPTHSMPVSNNGFYFRDFSNSKYPYINEIFTKRYSHKKSDGDTPKKTQWYEQRLRDLRKGIITPFQDTNPSGLRRGAIAAGTNGSVHLIDDERKWKIVRSGFAGCKALSGTSTYFTSDDTIESTNVLNDSKMSTVSYLIEFVDRSGNERWSSFYCNAPIARSVVFRVISTHAQTMGWMKFRAHEMELYGSNCWARDRLGNTQSVYGNDNRMRSDHYLLTRPKQPR